MQQHDFHRVDPASPGDAPSLAVLFEEYRLFYGVPPDPQGSAAFVKARLEKRVTRFLVARRAHELLGFAHLLPSFDTLATSPMWILEDLFVNPLFRRRGIGSSLLQAAEKLALETGADRLTLATAHSNVIAQRLYEKHGWMLDKAFRHYHRILA
jgi:GNAT superfamily N-acetyltransferase